jgi:hypothetical protein
VCTPKGLYGLNKKEIFNLYMQRLNLFDSSKNVYAGENGMIKAGIKYNLELIVIGNLNTAR